MWTPVRKAIERVRVTQSLKPSDFRPVVSSEWLSIQRKVDDAFRQTDRSVTPKPLLWTQLRPGLTTAVLTYLDENEHTLPTLRAMWREEDLVFFFAKEGVSDPKTWWYYTNSAVAGQLLEHLWLKPGPLQEWDIVDRKYQWAVFVTHSNDILFCGEPLVSQVRQISQQAGIRIL